MNTWKRRNKKYSKRTKENFLRLIGSLGRSYHYGYNFLHFAVTVRLYLKWCLKYYVKGTIFFFFNPQDWATLMIPRDWIFCDCFRNSADIPNTVAAQMVKSQTRSAAEAACFRPVASNFAGHSGRLTFSWFRFQYSSQKSSQGEGKVHRPDPVWRLTERKALNPDGWRETEPDERLQAEERTAAEPGFQPASVAAALIYHPHQRRSVNH